MAKHEDLPIYKITYDMLILVVQKTNKFPREYKYTFGEKIQGEAIKIIMGIYRANKSLDKTKDHRGIRDSTKELRVLIN